MVEERDEAPLVVVDTVQGAAPVAPQETLLRMPKSVEADSTVSLQAASDADTEGRDANAISPDTQVPARAQSAPVIEVETPVVALLTLETADGLEIIRLAAKVRIGEVTGSYVGLDDTSLYITLGEDVDRARWARLGEAFVSADPVLEAYRIEEILGSLALVLEASRPLRVLDQTVNIDGLEWLDWELVLHKQPLEPVVEAPVVADAPVESLRTIELDFRANVLEFSLFGVADFVAQVHFHPEHDALVIELPGDSASRVEQLLPRSLPRDVNRIEVRQGSRGEAILWVFTDGPFDLVDAFSEIDKRENLSVTRLFLVPDAEPLRHTTARRPVLEDVSLRPADGLDLVLMGIQDAEVRGYILQEPDRLMVDILGVDADDVEQAVQRFLPDGTYISRIRFGDTRLGSARLELTLTEDYALALRDDVAPFRQDFGSDMVLLSLPETERLIIAERDPPIDLADALTRALNLRMPPRIEYISVPSMTMGSVRLERHLYEGLQIPAPAVPRTSFSILSAFDLALDRDPTFLAARAELRVNEESLPQARSGLLPSVDFTMRGSMSAEDVRESGTLELGRRSVPRFNQSFNLTQPLYRPQSSIVVDQARVSIDQARLALYAAEQELIVRVAEAYLGILMAADEHELAVAELDAIRAQADLAEVSFRNGLLNPADLSDARSRLAVDLAREIKAKHELEDAQLAMKELIGDEIGAVKTFAGDFSPALPFPASVEPWVQAAIENNLAYQTRKLAVQIAELEIRRQSAGRLPTVDLVANAGQQREQRTLVSDARQNINSAEIALQLTVPLYSGGRTSSLVRESVARMDREGELAERERRKVERDARSTFQASVASARMIDALRESVRAEQVKLETRLRGLESGIDTQVAVMDAYQSYFRARRDFAAARFDYLLNRLALKQAVGTLSRSDLEDLESLLDLRS